MGGFLGWCVATAVSAALVVPRNHDSGLVGEIDAVERQLEACRAARRGIEERHPAQVWAGAVLRLREGQLAQQTDYLIHQARPFSMLPGPRSAAASRMTRGSANSIASTEREFAVTQAALRAVDETDPAQRRTLDFLRERASQLGRELEAMRSATTPPGRRP